MCFSLKKINICKISNGLFWRHTKFWNCTFGLPRKKPGFVAAYLCKIIYNLRSEGKSLISNHRFVNPESFTSDWKKLMPSSKYICVRMLSSTLNGPYGYYNKKKVEYASTIQICFYMQLLEPDPILSHMYRIWLGWPLPCTRFLLVGTCSRTCDMSTWDYIYRGSCPCYGLVIRNTGWLYIYREREKINPVTMASP